jgi:hypoxanthine phosphoribosyltransferase
MSKVYVTYEMVHNCVQHLAAKLSISSFKPDYIIAIGTGGFIPARILKSFIDVPILCINLSHYDDESLNTGIKTIQMIHKNSPEHDIIRNKNVLIVDELDDTCSTLLHVVDMITQLGPKELGVAVLHNKVKTKVGELPESVHYFYSKQVPDKWIVYPWENVSFYEQQKNAGVNMGTTDAHIWRH